MDTITKLTTLDFSSIFISVFIILIGIKTIVSLFEWVVEKLGLDNKWTRKKRENHELLISTTNSLKELSEEHKKDMKDLYDNNIIYREQSRIVREELKKSINDIFDKLDEMQEKTDKRFEENEKNTNRRIRAELKDKIGQYYRYYHKIVKINDMELEALEDLIKEYESVKGENSFVHSVVQKEMYTWEQVERI